MFNQCLLVDTLCRQFSVTLTAAEAGANATAIPFDHIPVIFTRCCGQDGFQDNVLPGHVAGLLKQQGGHDIPVQGNSLVASRGSPSHA